MPTVFSDLLKETHEIAPYFLVAGEKGNIISVIMLENTVTPIELLR